MEIPPSLAIYLMNRRKLEQPQLKPAVQPAEEINIFHVPAQNAPFPIQGTKLGILSQSELRPGEREDDKAQLLKEVQCQLQNLKNVLKLNKKEQFVVEEPMPIEEVAGLLSHKQQLEVMTELVQLRKEVQQMRDDGRRQSSSAVKLDSSTVNSKAAGFVGSPQVYLGVQTAEPANVQIPHRNSYHTEVNEYPNHYSRRNSASSQSGSCLGVQEDFVQLQRDGIRAVNPQFSDGPSSEQLYQNSYGPRKRASPAAYATDPRKYDNVDKLPYKNAQKRQIVAEITEQALSGAGKTALQTGIDSYDKLDLLQPKDYSKYGDLRYSDKLIRGGKQSSVNTPNAQRPTSEQNAAERSKICVFLPVVNARTKNNLLGDRGQLAQSNESALRMQRQASKNCISGAGDDIFVQMLSDSLDCVGRTMVEMIDAELNVRE